MGGKGSPSKTKSSKKKRNKVSSKAVKKKKSRRNESKILHIPASDSVSLSSKSTRSESSELDYKIRKIKSKKRRRDVSVSSYSDYHPRTSAKRRKPLPQGRKNRAQKRYESPDSNAESRRRKRSSRHRVVKLRNNPLKTKSRRHFTSSSCSDSESCSPCDSKSSISTGEVKRQRSKMMLDEEIKRSRGRESHRVRRKRKLRSPSGSSCGRCRDHDISVDQSEEALIPVDNSRRLKSVIAIVNRPTDEKDPHKEEIVCDHDDYPSPKSMDSNEGVTRKESDDQTHGTSKRTRVENVESEVILPMKAGNIGSERYNAADSLSHDRTNSSEIEKEIHVSVNAALDGDKKDGVGDGLEVILRQKALENLRRFKGGLQAARKSINLDTKNDNVDESSMTRDDNIQNKSTETNSFRAREMEKRSMPTLPEVKRDPDADQTATDPPKAPTVFAVNDTNQGAVGHSSKEQQTEAKNGSEFEQKTMSVMRGGEMVQVSYKVYIPKRAPALDPRRLRR